jgi:hypothetical protein
VHAEEREIDGKKIRRNLRSQSKDYLEDIQTNEDAIYGSNA